MIELTKKYTEYIEFEIRLNRIVKDFVILSYKKNFIKLNVRYNDENSNNGQIESISEDFMVKVNNDTIAKKLYSKYCARTPPYKHFTFTTNLIKLSVKIDSNEDITSNMDYEDLPF